MPSADVTLRNDVGLHARPAAVFAKTAAGFDATITVSKGGQEANAKSVLSVLKLDVRAGDTVTLTAEGSDADEAIAALVATVESFAESS